MMRVLRFAALAAIVVLAVGCTKAGIRYQDVYSSGKNYVRLAVENDREGNPLPRGYDHPHEFTCDQVRRILEDVQFQEYAFFAWRKEKRLFIEEEVDRLAPHLVAAFAQATPDRWIDFATTARKRDYLLPTPRITDGWMFIQDGKLNIILKNLNFELIDYDERALGDPRKTFAVGSYRFVTILEQHSKPDVVKDDPNRRYDHTNWLIVDLAPYEAGEAVAASAAPAEEAAEPAEEAEEPAAETTEPAPEAEAVEPAAPTAGEPSIKERLQQLQELLDGGLITQEEYEQKKKAILDEL